MAQVNRLTRLCTGFPVRAVFSSPAAGKLDFSARYSMNKWPNSCVYPAEIMKLSSLALAILPVVLAGCVERTVYVRQPPPPPPVAAAPAPDQPSDVVVTEAPPPPQQEVIVAAPGPEFVWTPGYWGWRGRWVWIGGRWAHPPHRHAVWVAGHWGHRGHGYVWVGGRWR
jgi:hypothetical protein